MDEVKIAELLIVFLFIFLLGIGVWYYLFMFSIYGGKSVYCAEDFGVEFNTTISRNFLEFIIFFSYDDSGLKFMGTDGVIYMCRGIAKIGG